MVSDCTSVYHVDQALLNKLCFILIVMLRGRCPCTHSTDENTELREVT